MLRRLGTSRIPTDDTPAEAALKATDTAFGDTEAGGWAARAGFDTASTTVAKHAAKADSPLRWEQKQPLAGLTGLVVELVVVQTYMQAVGFQQWSAAN